MYEGIGLCSTLVMLKLTGCFFFQSIENKRELDIRFTKARDLSNAWIMLLLLSFGTYNPCSNQH